MTNGLVIGAGLNGLIAGVLTGYTVVGLPDKAQGNFGPRILECTEQSLKFLDMIYNRDMACEVKTFNIFYQTRGGLIKAGEVGREKAIKLREKYNKKVRGSKNFSSSSMSGGKTKIVGWDINEIKLTDMILLSSKLNLDRSKIKFVDPVNLIAVKDKDVEKSIAYNDIINTIPIDKFMKLCGLPFDVSPYSKDTYFSVHKFKEDQLPMMQIGEYAYCACKGVKFHRFTKVSELEVCFESHEDFVKDEIGEFAFLGIEESKYKRIPRAQVVSNLKIPKIANTRMEGRYARWDQSIKLDSTIDSIMT